MRLRKLTLRHFRNVGFAALEFAGRQTLFVGANGQGKTNLLEAAGFVTALRSFRTTDNKLLIGHGQPGAALAYVVEHERLGETNVTIKLRHEGKELWHEQTRVTRLAEHLGLFPTVVFSSQDLQLVRGSPAARRRWLDLTLAAMDASYLRTLQTYAKALAGRNALLKTGPGALASASGSRRGDEQFVAFERVLADAGAELIARRTEGLAALGASVARDYARLCGNTEEAALRYEPNFGEASGEALFVRLATGRTRDVQFRTTLVGPHRDDFEFVVRGTPAKDFASEGQQRSLVLALRLAQAAWFRERSGVRPVLLADDVLGELDPARRRSFWSTIDPESQVIATGTHAPDGEGLGAWQRFEVAEGVFTEKAEAAP